MKKKLDIFYMAKSLKLSPSSVSKALNDKNDISLKTKMQVRAMAEKIKYEPDYLARALAMGETKTIGLIVRDIEISFFPDIARSIGDYMDKYGYRVLLSWSKGKKDKELSLLKDLKGGKVDGIIIVPVSNRPNLSFFREQVKENYPLVTIDNFLPQLKASHFVGTDFRKGTFLAVNYLISLDHKQIGFLGPFKGTFSAGERLKGYKEAISRAGIEAKEKFIFDVPTTIKAGYGKVKRLLGKVTAIFCANDLIAIGALNYLKEAGIKVPEEISIIGFGNIVEARNTEIPLTTMDQKSHLVGENACEMLLKLIHKEDIKRKVSLIEPELVVRESTKRKRKK